MSKDISKEKKKEKVEIKTLYLEVKGNRPTQEEAERLCATPFPRTPPSSQEVKNATGWFLFGIGVAVFGWFFGRWVIRNFRGPGVLFFGYGAAYLVPPASLIFGISSLGKLFRSSRKKKPEKAMRWLWITSLIGEDRSGKRFGKPEYALATLRRLIPPDLPFDKQKVSEYIADLRKTLGNAADRASNTYRSSSEFKWAEASSTTDLKLREEEELYPGVKELRATLTFKDRLSRSINNETYTVTSGVLEIDITQTFISSGGYWFPYEICSPVQLVEK